MNKEVSKLGLISVSILVVSALSYSAYRFPGYLTSQSYLGGLVLLELLAACVWFYRKWFFPLVMLAFLMAGLSLPMASAWTAARWLVLCVGAIVGCCIIVRERRYPFGAFHVMALFSVFSAFVSVTVSRYAALSSLKALSLLLLFLYASTGARLAVANREERFFDGLLVGCECLVVSISLCYLLGWEVMGNPNSLGALMGVVAAPLLLWGTMLKGKSFRRRMRLILFTVTMYLTFMSHARAAILAALVACVLLCLVLRKYSLLAQGLGALVIVVASLAIFQPRLFSQSVSSFTSGIVYKGKAPSEGLLNSRTSPWRNTIDTIGEHFWFGTGFGTSDRGPGKNSALTGMYASSNDISTEHGSSYLALGAWVGVIGLLPFGCLLGILSMKTFQAIRWTYRTSIPSHPAVPLSIVIVAALVNAIFEDWLFAPGYYLCVFFWSIAFVFVDQATLLPVFDSGTRSVRIPTTFRQEMDPIVRSQ
jgi:O-antigen ligase